jgi:UDP-2,3-diacylglucosamine hydrolase
MAVLFISDLHLSGERPAILGLFQSFLAGEAARAEALYILGDLFEAWLGDDAVTPDSQPVLDGLKRLTGTGVPVYVMRGNRDFLLGERFARLTGCRLLADEHVIDLYGNPTLLLHGDTLCTDDVEYQQVRAMVRSPAWQQAFLAKSIDERIRFAREARAKSREVTQNKAEEIMDVNAQAVGAALERHGVSRLIHGHTHRPAVHRHDLHGKAATRIVLGDWYSQSSVLRVDETGFLLSGVERRNWY